MKTPKEFYEMHHPIDVDVETKEGYVKMMEGYAEYVLQQLKNLNIPVSNCPDLTNVWYKILEEHADDIPTRDKFCDALWMLEAGGFCQLKFAI